MDDRSLGLMPGPVDERVVAEGFWLGPIRPEVMAEGGTGEGG